jgi:hypothetical protein
MSLPSEQPAARESQRPDPDALTRFFGGSPLSVIFRLAMLSIIIGVILEVLGLDPLHLMESLRTLFLRTGIWASTQFAGCGAISCWAPPWWYRSGCSFASPTRPKDAER